jgi:hypothetical protein
MERWSDGVLSLSRFVHHSITPIPRYSTLSVLWHCRVDLFRPGGDAAFEVIQLPKTRFL